MTNSLILYLLHTYLKQRFSTLLPFNALRMFFLPCLFLTPNSMSILILSRLFSCGIPYRLTYETRKSLLLYKSILKEHYLSSCNDYLVIFCMYTLVPVFCIAYYFWCTIKNHYSYYYYYHHQRVSCIDCKIAIT